MPNENDDFLAGSQPWDWQQGSDADQPDFLANSQPWDWQQTQQTLTF